MVRTWKPVLALLSVFVLGANQTGRSEEGGVEIATGLSPSDAAAAMTVPNGFRATLAAGEPDVHQPIGFTIDERGRLWVAEAFNYPLRAPEGQGRDRVIILEDQDLDGSFETRKVFAEGLNLVSGIEIGFGGVWIGAAPYLLFIPDADRDDKPDAEPQILLDGFGLQDTHETLNAFIWGPDGWLYGCHGVFTHSRVGKPGTPADQRIGLNAGVWRYHPTRHEFEVFAWGTSNPWGVDFNDHGHAFITACVIPHLWHVVQGARYHRQGGQHFEPYIYDDIKTIAEHRHYVGNIRDHAWWGHEPDPPTDTLRAGGGHAHCGAMVYLGDNWPSEYRNKIFMHNVHGNRINTDQVIRKGSGYTGRRAPDLMLANDKWFRGINLKCGPNGSVYLIDWYDRNACHRTNPEIWDRTNGRIFNIAFGQPSIERVDLSKLTDDELVELHLHANDWYVRMARRLLQERSAEGKLSPVFARLRSMAQSHPDVTRRLRAIWTLHACDGLDGDQLAELMGDSDENIRCWAIQLEMEDRMVDRQTLERLAKLARDDGSAIVRLYLASAMQRLPLDKRWPIAAGLLSHSEDSSDHNLPLMYWYGIAPAAAHDPERAMQLVERGKLPVVRQFCIRQAASSPKSLPVVVDRLGTETDPTQQQAILGAILRGFEGQVGIPMPDVWKTVYEKLAASPDEAVRERADQVAILMGDQRVYPRMRALLTDRSAPLKKRREALAILVRGQDKTAASAFQAVLHQPELRGAAIRALAACDDPDTPKAILNQYISLNDLEKRDAVGTMTARPRYADELLDAIQNETIPRTDLHAYNVRQILNFNDPELSAKLRDVWGEIRESSVEKLEAMKKYRDLCSSDNLGSANLSNGRRVFASTCATCHKMFGVGESVGPDITGSNRTNLDYILENIIDPSAVLGKDYRMTILEMADGRVVSGLIQRETNSAITMRTLNDSLIVPKAEIDYRELSQLSMMPEGLLDQLKPNEVRDLIAYLGSPAQVPLQGPAAPIPPDTGQVPDAVEGETMKVIGKTDGHVRSQDMRAFSADRWSDNTHLWWTGAGVDSQLDLELSADVESTYDVEVVLTRAPDYGIAQLSLNGRKLGEPIDLYAPTVVTSGVFVFKGQQLTAGKNTLSIQILGSNPQAIKSYMVGLDYVRLVPSTE